MHRTLLTISLLEILLGVESAKILMFPTSINSHIIFFSQLGIGLAEQGHEVQLLLSSSINISTHRNFINKTSGSFTYFTYTASPDRPFSNNEEMSQAIVEVALAKTPWERFWKSLKADAATVDSIQSDCLDLMRNKVMLRKLSETGFQFAIVDIVGVECRHLLPVLLGIPFGTYSTPWLAWLYRVPRLQSFTPFNADSNSNVMNFYERVCTFVREIIYMYFYNTLEDFSMEFLPPGNEKLNVIRLIERANLWFFLEDLSTSWPNANMPNTISIGDIMVNNDVKPLPEGLEEFIGNRDTGIVSFGSFFDHVPGPVIKQFCESFKSFSGKIKFIWKLKYSLNQSCPGADNILILPWLPQNDLLAHSAIKFFITHGGLNSIIESVNHKKPMIIFPIAFDQFGNSAVASSKGYAISLSLSTFTVDDMINAIESILNDHSYQYKVELYSSILNDKPDKPGERASRLINHVLKYGDEHLRTSAYQLTPFQFIMVDVVAFVMLMLIVLICVTIFITYFFLKRLISLISRAIKNNRYDIRKKHK